MANDCTDIDVVLRQINQRLRKLEKSDSEKNEEIGRLNRVINQKDAVDSLATRGTHCRLLQNQT
ncbi:hypothetical protein [Prevotella sp.]|nr:hypothetical protein [Prevotella sp.]